MASKIIVDGSKAPILTGKQWEILNTKLLEIKELINIDIIPTKFTIDYKKEQDGK